MAGLVVRGRCATGGTDMNDDQLREFYQESSAQAVPSDLGPCVSADQLRALVDKVGSVADRLKHLDHVMSCADCHRDFELLRSIAAAERADVPPG